MGTNAQGPYRSHKRPLVAAVLMCSGITCLGLFLIPINFVNLTPKWAAVNTVLLVVGGASAIVYLFATRSNALVGKGALFMLALTMGPLVAGLNLRSAAGYLVVVLIGLSVGSWFRWQLTALLICSCLLSLSLGVEALVHRAVYSSAFGPTRFVSFASRDDFRARGLLGQPVPAAAVAVILFIAVWMSSRSSVNGNRLRFARLSAFIFLVLALATTGTRSALVVLSILASILLIRRIASGSHRFPGPAVCGSTLLFLAGFTVLAATWIAPRVGEWRLTAFDDLTSTLSYQNRSGFLVILESVTREDGLPQLLGHGLRSLQGERERSAALLGLHTADNQYVTSAWDSGWLGLIALVALMMLAIKRMLESKSQHPEHTAAAVVVTALLFGAFFDVLYVRPCLLAVSIAVGGLSRTHAVPAVQEKHLPTRVWEEAVVHPARS